MLPGVGTKRRAWGVVLSLGVLVPACGDSSKSGRSSPLQDGAGGTTATGGSGVGGVSTSGTSGGGTSSGGSAGSTSGAAGLGGGAGSGTAGVAGTGGGMPTSDGWIGSPCDTTADCTFDDAWCAETEAGQPGFCTLPCDLFCPDPEEPGLAGTFCVSDELGISGEGLCRARCDWERFPSAGCQPNFECRWTLRHNDDTSAADSCMPILGDTSCDGDEVRMPNTGVVEPAGQMGCPAGMTPIDAGSCIDRWEAHLVEVLPDGELPWSPYFNPRDARVRAVSAPGAVPQGYISGEQAQAACQEAGKRLCSSSEWIAACRGALDQDYPYGSNYQDGVCNGARSGHPVIEYFGTDDDWIWGELDNACISQLPMSLAATGDYAGCVSQGGAFDLVGNLHEWVDDAAGTFRGGFYVDTIVNGAGCGYATTAHSFGYWDYSTGFRCCADR